MKIGFYSPYLDSLSGGERYVLTIASHWSRTHDVHVFWSDARILHKAQVRLNVDLSRVSAVENVFGTRNIFRKMVVSRGYDLIFFLSDGSIPTSFARHNILHFQVPFQRISAHSVKLSRYQAIVCNSVFTKRNISAQIASRASVIYPPVVPVPRTKRAKKPIILSVGRFHPFKKQDVLIEAFRKAVKGPLAEYSLVLVGGVLPADTSYLKRLQTTSKHLPVTIVPNATIGTLHEYYRDATVYWHAAGYHETNPEHMEHFGITTAEAMSAGAVPVIYKGGGLPEIVREGKDGFLWKSKEELISQTVKVITSVSLTQSLSKSAIIRAGNFSEKKFIQSFDTLLASITG